MKKRQKTPHKQQQKNKQNKTKKTPKNKTKERSVKQTNKKQQNTKTLKTVEIASLIKVWKFVKLKTKLFDWLIIWF